MEANKIREYLTAKGYRMSLLPETICEELCTFININERIIKDKEKDKKEKSYSTVEISGCRTCIFSLYRDHTWSCTNFKTKTKDINLSHGTNPYEYPKWCPLKLKDALITLEKD